MARHERDVSVCDGFSAIVYISRLSAYGASEQSLSTSRLRRGDLSLYPWNIAETHAENETTKQWPQIVGRFPFTRENKIIPPLMVIFIQM